MNVRSLQSTQVAAQAKPMKAKAAPLTVSALKAPTLKAAPSHRLPPQDFAGLVPRQWPEMTVVILASGPSLTSADIDRVASARMVRTDLRIIVINGTYRAAPWADVLYACDPPWWDEAQGAPDFPGQKWTQVETDMQHVQRWNLHWVRGLVRNGLSQKRNFIYYGGNSGYQAINLGALMGAKRIICLGYDMKAGADGRKHHHDAAPHKGGWPVWQRWIDRFATMKSDLEAMNIDVINATRSTAIPETTFRRMSLEAALCL